MSSAGDANGTSADAVAASSSYRYTAAAMLRNNRTGAVSTSDSDPVAPFTERAFNGTGYFVENDDVDNSFTDIQTLFLACFATLVPLVLSLLTAFAVRILWRKYRRNRECRTYDGVLHQEDSADHLAHSGAPLHSHLLNSEKVKTCESQFSITPDEIECSGSPVMYSGSSSRTTNHASANGSIITMTLKNNHLIVETEERNDIIEDSRETTMKYSPSLQDGVFVVEVQQGVRSTPGVAAGAGAGKGYSPDDTSVTDQRALVHNPPERFSDEDTLDEVDEEYYAETTSPKPLKSSSTNTGLSQSSLSVCSTDPSNPSYRYGNQQGYDNGYYGYPVYNGYINEDPLPRQPEHNKPKIMSAVYKQNGRLVTMQSVDPEGGLSSDKYAKQGSASNPNQDEDPIQEEQQRLGNMPKEGDVLYSQLKNSLIQPISPKFEKLQNDLSPAVEANGTSKDYENKAFETTELRNTK